MIILTLLTIIMVGILVYGCIALCAGGIAFAVVFGDLIVCLGLVYLIIRAFVKKKRK